MPDTSSKTMDPKNVVYPDSRHAPLGVWSSAKATLPVLLASKIDGDVSKLKFAEANKLIGEALKTKDAKKDVYFKVGLIGRDLVVRVKAKSDGIGQILGYDQKDALLLKNCALKGAAKPAKATSAIDFPTYYVLTPGDCKPLVTEYFQFGDKKGFGLKLSITVEGAETSANLRDTVGRAHAALCAEYRRKAKDIVDELNVTLAGMRIRSGSSLTEAAVEAQSAIEDLLFEATIAKELKKRVQASIASDANLKGHAKEWKVRGACTAVVTTLKLATGIVRVVASHGAEVTAYLDILKCGYAFYTLIKDFLKKEEEVAKELTASILLYRKTAQDLLDSVKDIYAEKRLAATTKLGKLEAVAGTAADALAVVQNKVTAKIKSLTGKDVGQAPEKARKRYLVELGKLVGGLDKQFSALEAAMDKFRTSSIVNAVKVWPKLQALKAACVEAKTAFAAKKTFADNARDEIEALGVAVDDKTTVDKLRELVDGLRTLNKDKVISGAAGAASVASVVYGTYSAAKAFGTEIAGFA